MRWLVVMLAACGRLGFEPGGGATDDAAITGDGGVTTTDAPGGGTLVTVTGTNVTTDTFISQDLPDDNFGSADNIRLERDQGDKGLLRFDLAAIPATATITSANLRVFVEVATVATIAVHPVLEAWTEGNLDGDTGFTNYVYRQPFIIWSLLGAAQPASIGAQATTFAVTATSTMIDVALPLALVQGWVANAATNNGMLFASNSDQTVRLVSSEGPAPQRPVLTITYQ